MITVCARALHQATRAKMNLNNFWASMNHDRHNMTCANDYFNTQGY